MFFRVTKSDTSSCVASFFFHRKRLPELPKKLWRCGLKLETERCQKTCNNSFASSTLLSENQSAGTSDQNELKLQTTLHLAAASKK